MVVRCLIGLLALATLGSGCMRCGAPEAPDARAPAPLAPPARDAASDATDARSDAGDGPMDAPVHHHARKTANPSGGGSVGFKVVGSLPRDEAQKVVRAGFSKARACNRDLPGRVVFRLTVDGRGRVTLGEVVSSTLGGGDPEMCMVRAMRDLKFPAGAGESTVSFQMSFGR